MKTLFQKITLVIGVITSLGLASCEKDALLNPNPAGSARLGAAGDDILPSPNTPQYKHTLVKYGNVILSYADNGQLRKVATAPGRGGADAHTDYTYSPGSVRAISYAGSAVVRDETFTLDASGRCTESVLKGTNGDIHWAFYYNPKGQLSYCANKAGTTGSMGYTYNADGDLTLVEKALNPYLYTHTTFTYDQPTNAPLLTDKYPLNVVGASDHDPYLRIFGTPSKHLVKRVSYEPSGDVNFPAPADRFYSYTLDVDGYVTERRMANTLGGNSVETTVYEYLVANPNM